LIDKRNFKEESHSSNRSSSNFSTDSESLNDNPLILTAESAEIETEIRIWRLFGRRPVTSSKASE